MTLKQHACVTVACDVCGETFTDEDEGGIPHFDDVREARDYQDAWDEEYRWTILDDGYAICPVIPADDDEHRAARAALVPVEAPTQVPGQQQISAVRGYRVGDMVKITGRGELLDGRTGPVAELDDDPEFGIGIRIEGFLDLVWCNSGEVRHLDAAEIAAAEAGAR